MVKKILNLFYKEHSGLHKTAIVLAISSVVSALFGILRDRLLASSFGASESLDIYYAAFKIPDFIYIISLSIISVNALIPFFLEKSAVSKEKAKTFLDETMTFFLLSIFILAGAGYFLIPHLSGLVAPGFSESSKKEFVYLARILLLSPIFLGLSNLVSSVIQSHNRFVIYALSPIFYNFGIIFGIVFLFPMFGMGGIVFGVVIGAMAHFAIQVPAIINLGYFPIPALKVNIKEFVRVAKLSLPRSLGLGLNQIILIFITASASLLSAGSIAVFNLSFNLQSVPLAVIGMSYSVAAFPTLSRLFIGNKKKEFLDQSAIAVRQIIFWSITASALIIVLRAQIVRTIFGSGNFGWQDTRLTAAAMSIFAFSITAQSLVVLFTRAFYASGKTWKPITINAISAVFIIGATPIFISLIKNNFFLASFFDLVLRVGGVAGTDMLALPLAYSLGMIANCVLLFISFQKEFGDVWSSARKTFFETLSASLFAGIVSYFSLNFLDNVFDINTFIGIFSQGFLATIFGGVVWFFFLKMFKNKELKEVTTAVFAKFWKTQVIASEPENLDRQ
ncbi:MAG: Integral membrane protein MviN [Candidatus Falkowbacteria bacterium GW2011_GWA2_41_14]|uniref:Integral membrane protein MviN n=1 Tax=Candidatus Falkowbacteria bacterium GW2011_GWA2_41_14 TaxID=1618635 RepID=A0A0G0X415_9BACT|nr:MAG: Integral membrane protein MviN [Candidatus Falkowbacteria bacterium GW2011_GWA2_41_14]